MNEKNWRSVCSGEPFPESRDGSLYHRRTRVRNLFHA